MTLTTLGLGLHFLLELCALAAVANWGFHTGDSRWVKGWLGVAIVLDYGIMWQRVLWLLRGA